MTIPTWTEVRSAPTRLSERTRARLSRARDDGRERLWTWRTTTLERAHGLLDRADDWPAVGRLAGAATRLVDRQLERLTSVPVEGWDELNARDAVKAVTALDRVALLAARRREADGKARVTVLRAIDARLGHAAA